MDTEKLRKRYKGPMMNQDIMDCIEEIERLRKLVKSAYEEGYNHAKVYELQYGVKIQENWENSKTKKALKEK